MEWLEDMVGDVERALLVQGVEKGLYVLKGRVVVVVAVGRSVGMRRARRRGISIGSCVQLLYGWVLLVSDIHS